MTFDLDAFRTTRPAPWQFTTEHRGQSRTYIARRVPAPACARFLRRLAKARNDRAREYALRALLQWAFPWRFSFLRYGDPVALLFALEPATRDAALRGFLDSIELTGTREAA